jgi:hypothetical protein
LINNESENKKVRLGYILLYEFQLGHNVTMQLETFVKQLKLESGKRGLKESLPVIWTLKLTKVELNKSDIKLSIVVDPILTVWLDPNGQNARVGTAQSIGAESRGRCINMPVVIDSGIM